MKAIAAHFRYISKNGRLEIEDERGQTLQGREAVRELAEDWRYGGSLIEDISPRREAFNIILSMPRGTDPESVRWAARQFVRAELDDHKVAMVLHDHQANPHVHVSVRAESRHGKRLNPRKTDLHRWRETFAAKLRERGVEAEATRQATRGVGRRHPDLWQVKAREDGRLLKTPANGKGGAASKASRDAARKTWRELAAVLATTGSEADRQLARSIEVFASGMTQQHAHEPGRDLGRHPTPSGGDRAR
jgi:hypothetical protein